MLKIEVIKFEAQDVITASVAVPAPIVHTENCSNAMNYSQGNTHDYSMAESLGYSNPAWLPEMNGWFDCNCECHK